MNSLLAAVILQFAAALKANTEAYLSNDKSHEDWYAEFLRLLAQYLMLAMMAGLNTDTLSDEQEQVVADALINQNTYVDGFAQEIDSLTPEQAIARTELYASSATEVYWRGNTWGLRLPAYPADGSAECLEWDKCSWVLVWLDRTKGDVNAYWTLGEAEHCPTCLRRSEEWNPLKVRNWKY